MAGSGRPPAFRRGCRGRRAAALLELECGARRSPSTHGCGSLPRSAAADVPSEPAPSVACHAAHPQRPAPRPRPRPGTVSGRCRDRTDGAGLRAGLCLLPGPGPAGDAAAFTATCTGSTCPACCRRGGAGRLRGEGRPARPRPVAVQVRPARRPGGRDALRSLLLVFLRDHGPCVWRCAGMAGPASPRWCRAAAGGLGPIRCRPWSPYLTLPWVRLPPRIATETRARSWTRPLSGRPGARGRRPAAGRHLDLRGQRPRPRRRWLAGARSVAVVVLGRHVPPAPGPGQ